MSIGVTAATSQLGKLALEHLVNHGLHIVAFARKPENITAAVAEKRALDYTTATASDFAGISTLLLISTGSFDPPRYEQHKKVVDAAKAAGVKKILYTSILKASTSPMLLAHDHKATEEYIEAAGLELVALRNGWYTENWLMGIENVLRSGSILGANHGAKVSPATRRDYGEAAAHLTVKVHRGESVKKHWEFGGEAFTLNELAAEITAVSGTTVKYVDFDQDTYAKTLESFGFPGPAAFIFAQADDAAGQGALYVETTDLVEALGHAPENWKDVVKATLKK